jgi:uncharacterized glyoxalase superfamily protein PhnB
MAQSFYPILMTEKYVETINYYEDHFDFIAEMETDTFTVLRHKKDSAVRIAVVAREHDELPEGHSKNAQGIILNYPVSDVQSAFEYFYMEGMDIKTDIKLSPCGRRHFMVVDPNGVLIDVMQEYDPFKEGDLDILKGSNENDFETEIRHLVSETTH